MNFNQWLYKVCEILGGGRNNETEIFSTIDLFDAKLSFIDGMTPFEYTKQRW